MPPTGTRGRDRLDIGFDRLGRHARGARRAVEAATREAADAQRRIVDRDRMAASVRGRRDDARPTARGRSAHGTRAFRADARCCGSRGGRASGRDACRARRSSSVIAPATIFSSEDASLARDAGAFAARRTGCRPAPASRSARRSGVRGFRAAARPGRSPPSAGRCRRHKRAARSPARVLRPRRRRSAARERCAIILWPSPGDSASAPAISAMQVAAPRNHSVEPIRAPRSGTQSVCASDAAEFVEAVRRARHGKCAAERHRRGTARIHQVMIAAQEQGGSVPRFAVTRRSPRRHVPCAAQGLKSN